ncbi:hypothetical protein [Roseiconus lacunae]|uniref:Transposase n=1 Tax=Roseiconus lacunae TaxID=2605694 RepID=A0ABT7PDG2_9BACT|nr:hypothetical protein [Roseiconus lacunae]MDM4014246.1 hypothetical protein [Roseiconus lacunae]
MRYESDDRYRICEGMRALTHSGFAVRRIALAAVEPLIPEQTLVR